MTARRAGLALVLIGLALPQGARALTVNVPLDPSGRVPGTLGLHVERIPARGAERGPLFVLEGGPGGSVTASRSYYERLFRRQLRDHELVLVDQRGTGRSGALRCPRLAIPASAPALGQADAAAACARRLGPRAALYTTRVSAADLDAVRRTLGLDRISLYGSSYGTKLGLAYMLLYPAHVERAVLDSVLPLDDPGFDLDSFRAIPRVLDKLCATGCDGITTDPVADTGRLVALIRRRGPLRGPVVDTHGRRRTGRIGRRRLVDVLLAGDYNETLRAAYPGAVRAALGGDHAPLLRLGRWAERGSQRVPARVYSDAMQTANECQEGPFPWDPAAPAADRLRQARARAAAIPSSALFPFDADTLLNDSEVAQLCSKWPLPQDSPLPSGPLPDVPTLLLSGEDDLRTPVEAAERVAGSIRGARLLTVPGVGHGVLDGASVCPRRAVDDFFAGRPPRPCTPGSAPAFADPVPPRSLRRMPTAPGHHGRAGRTLAAVYATVNDVDEAFGAATYSSRDLARVGGLRGGWAHDHYPRIRLHAYSYVPGVRVSGMLRGISDQHGRLRVGGRAAAHGVLRLGRDGTLRGRLR